MRSRSVNAGSTGDAHARPSHWVCGGACDRAPGLLLMCLALLILLALVGIVSIVTVVRTARGSKARGDGAN